MMKVLFMSLEVVLEQCDSLKARRAKAQRLVDLVKGRYNVSAKLEYATAINRFTLKVLALGEDQDYLERLADKLHCDAQEWTEEAVDAVYEIETWPWS